MTVNTGMEALVKVGCLAATMTVLCSFLNATHAETFTVSPDATSVSDGVVSYKVETLSEKEVLTHTPSLGWQVESCSLMIDIPIGIRDGNVSHGALCLRKEDNDIRHVFACYDDMVGHADIVNVHDDDATKVNLIEFTMERCYGG